MKKTAQEIVPNPTLREVGFFLHAYQPPRKIFLPSKQSVLDVVSSVNEEIYQKTYRPILVNPDPLLPGMIFSFYTTLREWIKSTHPEDFDIIKKRIQTLPNKEYIVLGDPYFHIILPFLPVDDQDMLIKLGKSAIFEDLGFIPKGFWLPEGAVSATTLHLLSKNGYEFTALESIQLTTAIQNPVSIKFPDGKQLSVFHFHPGLSYDISFIDEVTVDGEAFLDMLRSIEGDEFFMGSDIETFGHHKAKRDEFLRFVLTHLSEYEFAPIDIEHRLKNPSRTIVYSSVRENSSWSCRHRLGRWTGEPICNCDNPSDKTRTDKQYFYTKLIEANTLINEYLDRLEPEWRKQFFYLVLDARSKLLNGKSMQEELDKSEFSKEKKAYFLAKIFTLIGLTSCGWFFGLDTSPERQIPEKMIEEVEKILSKEN